MTPEAFESDSHTHVHPVFKWSKKKEKRQGNIVSLICRREKVPRLQKEKLGKAFGAGGGGTTFTKTKHTQEKPENWQQSKTPKPFYGKGKLHV